VSLASAVQQHVKDSSTKYYFILLFLSYSACISDGASCIEQDLSFIHLQQGVELLDQALHTVDGLGLALAGSQKCTLFN
jgi:hypothetical protein